MDPIKNKMLVIIGPTSAGKSELAVKLAGRFNGEIISVDSRQIYKGMNLGTGKINGKWHISQTDGRQVMIYKYKNISHHLIDFVSPKRQYSIGLFQKKAQKNIKDILKRKKLPILCGGAMHWIDAIVYDQQLPEVKPNAKLRRELEKKSIDNLYRQLKKLDANRAKTIDKQNKHRLIRALEIIITTGKPVPSLSVIPDATTGNPESSPITNYNTLWLGITLPQTELYKKIDKRLKQRIKEGMGEEVKLLHKQSVSWKRLESFGLEYKHVSLFLQGKMNETEMLTKLSFAIKHYSKRQLTWWKRNKKIIWIKNYQEAVKLTKKFLR